MHSPLVFKRLATWSFALSLASSRSIPLARRVKVSIELAIKSFPAVYVVHTHTHTRERVPDARNAV